MGTSPTPKRKVEKVEILPPSVDFLKAVGLLLEWKCISRLAWNDRNLFIFIDSESGNMKLHREGKFTDVVLHKNDLEATDWIVTNEDKED